MRIAYLINQYPTPTHSFIRREILALERLGFDVMRIAIRGWDSDFLHAEDDAERARTRYVLRQGVSPLLLSFARTLFTRPVNLIRALARVWRMSRHSDRPLHIHLAYLAEACRIERWLRVAGVKHLHAHFGTNSAEVAMLTHALGGPTWSFTVHGPEEFDKAPLIGLAEKIRNCSFVVAVSSFGRSQLYRQVEQQYWPKVHVVHCGLDPAFFESPTSPPPAARRLLCIGRLCEQKGQLLLVGAAHRVATERPDFELILAGDGELRGQIETMIAHHKVEANIRIMGWIGSEQIRNEILAARALVLPSFAEGLPVVLMEAMALGRPVISTYVGGIPELVRPGENGWLVPAGDIDALTDALRICLDAPADLLFGMGSAARTRVLARHDVNTEAKKLETLFGQTIDSACVRKKEVKLLNEHTR